jgi:hypothetical protein
MTRANEHKASFARRLFAAAMLGVALFAGLGAAETLSQRRRRVEAMPAEQIADLFRCEAEFQKLPEQDRQRLRDLHEQIENAPDRDVLRATMIRYCKWLETQPLLTRSEIDKKKSIDDRVAAIKDLGNRLRLDDKSRPAVAAWLDRFAAERGPRIIENMPSRPEIMKLPPDRQQAILREIVLRRWQMSGPNGPNGPMFAEGDLKSLRAALSPELRAKLEAKTPLDQARIMRDWLRDTASRELDEQLGDFFENVLGPEERDHLMSEPGDDMYKHLGEEYRTYVKQSKGPDGLRRGDQPWRGDRGPGKRGRRPGPPGNGDRRPPKDNPETGSGKDSKSGSEAPSPDSTGKPVSTERNAPAEKRDPVKAGRPDGK